MKMRKIFVVVLTGLMLTSACATDNANKKPEPMPVWPTPPEPTRIKFLRHYKNVKDIEGEKSFFEQLGDIFGGAKQIIGLYRANGVHVDLKGRIFITDNSRSTVLMMDPKKHTYEEWGSVGPIQLINPMGLCSDPEGNIYVGDLRLRRIVKYSPEGEYLKAYGRDGELVRPIGMFYDKEQRRLVVADPGQHKVVMFDVKSGDLVMSVGHRGAGEDEFNFPLYVAAAPDGGFWVTDSFNFKVKHFDAAGKFVSSFGCNGTNVGCFSKMKGIATDSEGHIYVVDAAFNNVQIFDQQGRLLLFFGNFGQRNGELVLPSDLAISSQDEIFVLDKGNYRVSVFKYVSQKDEKADDTHVVDKVLEVGSQDSSAPDEASSGVAPQKEEGSAPVERTPLDADSSN